MKAKISVSYILVLSSPIEHCDDTEVTVQIISYYMSIQTWNIALHVKVDRQTERQIDKRTNMPIVDPITRCPNVPFKLKSETESDFDGH